MTQTIARFITTATLADSPPELAERAKKVITDTFAAMLAGASSEVAEPLLRYMDATSPSGPGAAPILGTRRHAHGEMSALINGAFGHALDFDDVLSMMPAHPSAVILAALLAHQAEHPLSGAELIEAYVIGVEAGARIAQGLTVGHYARGFHATGTVAMFSALAALSRACRLDEAGIRTAVGIASSMASGVRCNFGTMTKPLHTGLAARNAYTAVRMAQAGISAAPNALEAKAGFFAAYGVAESDPDLAIPLLAKPWILMSPGIALKKFACCYAMHRAMDGVLELRQRHGFTADDIERLECRMPPGGMLVLTYPRPRTGLEGKFSLEYGLAAGALDGRYSLDTFTDQAVTRPAIQSLLERIHAFETPACRDDDPLYDTRSSGSRGFVEVEITLRNGVRDHVRVTKAPGHPDRELSWNDIEEKFLDCAQAAQLHADPTSLAFTQLKSLETCPDVAAIAGLLHHGPQGRP